MTEPQAVVFALLAATAGAFVLSRLPRDLVALAALVAGVLTGVVPAARAFDGFGDGATVILAASMLLSAAVAGSGAVEVLVRPLLRPLRDARTQVPALAGAVALLSTATRSVSALATLLPFATQLSQRTHSSRSALLMPMAFASVIGGLVTMVGTVPNIVAAEVRGELTGRPFGIFDFAPVGLGVAVAGVLFLCLGYRLLPEHDFAGASEATLHPRGFTAEARVPADSPFVGRSVADLESAAGEGAVRVGLILRERFRRVAPTPGRFVHEGDVLMLSGEPDDLERLISTAGLVLAGDHQPTTDAGEVVREGVVNTGSALVGITADRAMLRSRHGLGVLAVSRRGASLSRRLRFLRFQIGDVLILKGLPDRVEDAMDALRVLPLSERPMALGARRRSWAPLLVLAAAIALVILGIAPVAVAFTAGAIAVVLLGSMTADEAYRTVEWPLVVTLAALIPLSRAMGASGGTDLVAAGLAPAVAALPPLATFAMVLALAIVAASSLGAVFAVVVLAPVAGALARYAGLSLDALLMTVAVGSACGFLGPRGHGNNELVMAPGGYTPADYRRLGLPLALLVVVVGTALIALVWGLRA